jgi:hypothetical protein
MDIGGRRRLRQRSTGRPESRCTAPQGQHPYDRTGMGSEVNIARDHATGIQQSSHHTTDCSRPIAEASRLSELRSAMTTQRVPRTESSATGNSPRETRGADRAAARRTEPPCFGRQGSRRVRAGLITRIVKTLVRGCAGFRAAEALRGRPDAWGWLRRDSRPSRQSRASIGRLTS